MLIKVPNIKELRAEGIRKAHSKAKENNEILFSIETRKKFALAKCKKANNLLGYYIIENYSIDYNLIEKKVKRVTSRIYKSNENLLTQLEAIIATIINKTNKDIQIEKIIELTSESLIKKGIKQ